MASKGISSWSSIHRCSGAQLMIATAWGGRGEAGQFQWCLEWTAQGWRRAGSDGEWWWWADLDGMRYEARRSKNWGTDGCDRERGVCGLLL
jgi:hypothetical protein